MKLLRLLGLAFALAASAAHGQAVIQSGPWAPGHAPQYSSTGSSQPIVQDSGAARGGAAGLGLSELLLTARGTGTPPYAGQGTGPYGAIHCEYDAPTTNAAGYHYLCFSPNAQGGGLMAYGAGGIAPALPFQIIINGVPLTIPSACTGCGTMSAQNANAVAITGGTITGVSITGATITGGSISGVTGIRPTNPGNLYVSTTGNDSNTCLSVPQACLTIQRAANLAKTYDLQGSDITINLGAGTFTKGLNLTGPMAGGGALKIIGAGGASGTTTIDPSTTCSTTPHAIEISYGMFLKLGSLKLTTSCAGGIDLVCFDHTICQIVDGDFNLGPADAAAGDLVDAFGHSSFEVAGAFGIKISGGANIGFLGSTQSSIFLGSTAVNTIVGNPAFGVFVDLIDGSGFDTGFGSSFSGTATGRRYALALNSWIDTEQNTTPIPGDTYGTLASGSFFYDNTGIVCVGGAIGCRNVTAPTGTGTGGTVTPNPSSGDYSGSVTVHAGVGAGATGVFRLAQSSFLGGNNGSGGFCSTSLANQASAWATGATTQSYYDFASTGTIVVTWFNAGAALSSGSNYVITYVCS